MAESLLNHSDLAGLAIRVGGEGMSEHMRCDPLLDVGVVRALPTTNCTENFRTKVLGAL